MPEGSELLWERSHKDFSEQVRLYFPVPGNPEAGYYYIVRFSSPFRIGYGMFASFMDDPCCLESIKERRNIKKKLFQHLFEKEIAHA